MVALQIISKIIKDGNLNIILNNNLSKEHFIEYEDEYDYIKNHFEKYNTVPDKETFLGNFDDINLVEVTEPDSYLVDKINEELLYHKFVPIIQESANMLKVDSNSAVEYMMSNMEKLKYNDSILKKDIISQSGERLKIFNNKADFEDVWFIPTGFKELDLIIKGWSTEEELAVLFARTGQGKSWVLVKTLSHAWHIGKRVGYISPEMSAIKIGYRFDTVLENFSNTALLQGNKSVVKNSYNDYIEQLTKKDGFLVSTPKDFDKKITINKLKNYILTNKLDILGIDGITYLTDQRYKKGDNKTITLTNISEDLMSLSVELQIPIIVVVQSNRGGVKDDEESGTPELENIRDSDGIAQNATKVIALRQTGGALEFGIKKHRDGATGGKLNYYWDIDTGKFEYIPSDDDATAPKQRESKKENVSKKYNDKECVF